MSRDDLYRTLFLASVSAAAAMANPEDATEAVGAVLLSAAAADATTTARRYCDLITNITINTVCNDAYQYGTDIYNGYAKQNDGGFPTIDQIHADDRHNPCDDVTDPGLKDSCSWFESIGMANAQGLYQAASGSAAYAYQRMSPLNFSATIIGSIVAGGALTAAGIFYHQRKTARQNAEAIPLVNRPLN